MLFSALYGMYAVKLNELKTIFKGECTGRTKLYSEQNLSGINGPGRRLPKGKEPQEAYL
jgi:hypothetical protein